jgi:DNA polymerase-3 subunit delta'
VPVELSKKGADADKQIELAEEALGEEMARRRERPLYERPSGLSSHGIASVRLLLRRMALTPAMGRYKVFVIGEAERLVPQPGAEQAANALLKALEEPPHDTQFVLTTSDPDALLPTVLSRVVRVRVARLPDSVVTSFVHNELSGLSGSREPGGVIRNVTAAEGCPGRLVATGGGRGSVGNPIAEGAVRALRAKPAARYEWALSVKPFEARGTFSEMLDDLLDRLRDAVRTGGETHRLVQAIARVLEVRAQAQGNVNPQLIAAVLSEDLAGVL